MRKIRRTEINIETHERTVVRLVSGQFSVNCERCGKKVTVFAPEQIAALFEIALTDVGSLIEANEFHLVGMRRGMALVCGDSLGDKYKKILVLRKE